MKNVDVKIYITKLKTFFDKNPQELQNLIGDASPDVFFDEVYDTAIDNYENGEDVELKESQILKIIERLNTSLQLVVDVPMMDTSIGKIFLN